MRSTAILRVGAPGWLHLAWALLLILGLSGWGRADPEHASPQPTPTDAAAQASRRLQVEGYAVIPQGVETPRAQEMARSAALLNGTRRLLESALDTTDLGTDLHPSTGTRRLFRVSPEHPNDVLLGWVLRAQATYQVDPQAGQVHVKLVSPPIGELVAGHPQMVGTALQDLDGDGLPETIGAGFDGRIYILRNGQVVASTASQALYTSNTFAGTGEEWEQIRLRRVDSIRSVELAGPGQARVVANLSTSEEVAHHYVGSASEEREIVVGLQKEPGPEIQLEEPFDFSGTSEESMPMRGLLLAPAGVEVARLRFNGKPVWSTPEGLNSKRLKVDLVVPLLPGINRAQIQALDRKKRSVVREVMVRRNAPPPALDPHRRQALVIGIESYKEGSLPHVGSAERDAARVREALLASGGFQAERTHLLIGEQATREAILKALKDMWEPAEEIPGKESRGLVVIYFAGLAAPGAEGKTLLPWDASSDGLGASELVSALGPLDNQEVLLLCDSARTKSARLETVWLDNSDFLGGLEKGGWASIASSDPLPEEREGDEGSLLTGCLVAGLKGAADSNADGLVELDELYRYAFATLQERARGLAPQVPVLRGEILGRVPLARKGS